MRPEINLLTAPSPASLPLEIVERKGGVGHPDTICDALAEHLSVALSRIYLERFGAVQHHNVDKGLLWGGAARPAFGGGEMCAPIELHLGGRATVAVRDERLPVEELAVESSRAWLRANLRFLDPDRHVRIIPRIHATSAELAALFARQSEAGVPLANDTSFGVGFAPLDELERIVLAVERRLNAVTVKQAHPEIGEDVKVMGARRGRAILLTVACALVDRHVSSLADYRAKKASVAELALDAARGIGSSPVDVQVNTADGDTPESIYLTVTGLSVESGDDGQVGRGQSGERLDHAVAADEPRGRCWQEPDHARRQALQRDRASHGPRGGRGGARRRRGAVRPAQQGRSSDRRAAVLRGEGAARRSPRRDGRAAHRGGGGHRARTHRFGVARRTRGEAPPLVSRARGRQSGSPETLPVGGLSPA
jgi:S-adenosylmethionine synthetase